MCGRGGRAGGEAEAGRGASWLARVIASLADCRQLVAIVRLCVSEYVCGSVLVMAMATPTLAIWLA